MSLTRTEVAVRMARKGITAPEIAAMLDLDTTTVIDMGIQADVGHMSLDGVAGAMESIVWLVYEEAKRVMQFGSPAQKNFLMRLIIGYMMRTMAVQTPHAMIELQNEFHELMQSQGASPPEEIDADLQDIWNEADTDDPDEDD